MTSVRAGSLQKTLNGKSQVYSLSHTYPQYIGAGTYKRLAILFLQEAVAEEEQVADDSQDNRI